MSDAGRQDRVAIAALFLGGLGIAFAPIFVRASEVAPTATAFWRLALAAPLLALWTSRERGVKRPASPRDCMRLVLPGVFFALDLGVWHQSIRYTSIANATLLANLAPVFVTLGGWLVFGRRFTRLFLAGMVVAIAGAAILMALSLQLEGTHALGDLLGLVTALFYASYILSVGYLRAEFSTATILAWSTAAAALLLLPASLLLGESLEPPGLNAWLILAGLALISHVGGQGLIAYALAHLSAAFSSVTLLIQPALATLLAWMIFDEPFGGLQAVGGVIVLAGITLARSGSVRQLPRSSASSAASGEPRSGSSQ